MLGTSLFAKYHLLFVRNKAQITDRDNLSIFADPRAYYFHDPVLRKIPIFASCDRTVNRYFWERLTDNGAVFFSDAALSSANDARETLNRIKFHTRLKQIGRERVLDDFLRTCMVSFLFQEDVDAMERCVGLRGETVVLHPPPGDDHQTLFPWPSKEMMVVRAPPKGLLAQKKDEDEDEDKNFRSSKAEAEAESEALVDDASWSWCWSSVDATETPLLYVERETHLSYVACLRVCKGPRPPCIHEDESNAQLEAAMRKYLVEYVRFSRDVDYWLENFRAERILPRVPTHEVSDEDLPHVQVCFRRRPE